MILPPCTASPYPHPIAVGYCPPPESRRPAPNADQISSAPPWGKPACSALLSLLPAAQNTERAEEGDTESLQGGASRVQKCPSQAFVLRFPGAKSPPTNAPSKISPCLRVSVPSVFGAAGLSLKEKSLSDQHSDQPPFTLSGQPGNGSYFSVSCSANSPTKTPPTRRMKSSWAVPPSSTKGRARFPSLPPNSTPRNSRPRPSSWSSPPMATSPTAAPTASSFAPSPHSNHDHPSPAPPCLLDRAHDKLT